MTNQLKQLSEAATEEAKFLIQKSGAYYRPNSQGYTNSAIQAGRYTRSEAISITHPNGPDGPRDNMRFFHEDEIVCEDWKAYRALEAQLTEAQLAEDGAMQIIAAERAEVLSLRKQLTEARAQVAVAYEAAADKHDELWRETDGYKSAQIRALTPDHTTAALEQIKADADKAGFERGMKRAAEICMEENERRLALASIRVPAMAREIRDAILATLSADTQD